MANMHQVRFALGKIEDLTTPSSTQKYPLGATVTLEDTSKKSVKKFMYVKSHGALTQYVPYIITRSSTAGSEVITAAPFTLAAPGQLVCVPQVAFTSGYYGWVQIQGDCVAITTDETSEIGDFLQVLNAGVAFVVDGTSGSTTHSVNSSAVMLDADYASGGNDVLLIGEKAVTAGS